MTRPHHINLGLPERPLIPALSPEGAKVAATRAMTARGDARPTDNYFTVFFTTPWVICCKWLIEHLKLYPFFTIFIFEGIKFQKESGPNAPANGR